jgi:hypothetical protein
MSGCLRFGFSCFNAAPSALAAGSSPKNADPAGRTAERTARSRSLHGFTFS